MRFEAKHGIECEETKQTKTKEYPTLKMIYLNTLNFWQQSFWRPVLEIAAYQLNRLGVDGLMVNFDAISLWPSGYLRYGSARTMCWILSTRPTMRRKA